MRALRYYGPGDVRLENDVPEPPTPCPAGQVKIKPKFCGICGSDLFAYLSDRAIPFKDTPHPLTGETWPITLGHEFSGEVVEVGERGGGENKVSSLGVGDRVTVQPSICCGGCPPCHEGSVNCCDQFGFVGLSGGGGGLSDLVCVKEEFVYKLPENVPLDVGALAEPLAVAWHAVDQAGVQPGDDALVMGAGPIGLAVIQCLRARGVKSIIAVELANERKEFARRLGASVILDPNQDDVVAKAKEICAGRGPRLAFECAGVEAGIKAATGAVQKRGVISILSSWKKEVSFDFNMLLIGEKRVLSVLSYTSEDFKNVVEALGNGSMGDLGQMITRKVGLDRVVEDGILALLKGGDKQVKIMADLSM